eukprot:94141-Pelagomonas_calceolata.AAC.4
MPASQKTFLTLSWAGHIPHPCCCTEEDGKAKESLQSCEQHTPSTHQVMHRGAPCQISPCLLDQGMPWAKRSNTNHAGVPALPLPSIIHRCAQLTARNCYGSSLGIPATQSDQSWTFDLLVKLFAKLEPSIIHRCAQPQSRRCISCPGIVAVRKPRTIGNG